MTHEPPVPPPPPPPAPGMPPPPPSSSQDQVAQAAADISAKAGAAYHDARRRFLGLEEPERFTVGGAVVGLVGAFVFTWSTWFMPVGIGVYISRRAVDVLPGWLVLVGLGGALLQALRPAVMRGLLDALGRRGPGVNTSGLVLAGIAVLGVVSGRIFSGPDIAALSAQQQGLTRDSVSFGLGWYLAAGGAIASVWGTFRRFKISGP